MLVGWRQALALAVVLLAAGTALRAAGRARVARWPTEVALLLALYAGWQEGLNLFANHVRGAVANGMGVWRAERWLHLPRERSLQQWFLSWPTGLRALNYYYAVAHVQDVMLCLAWLFWRHEESYGRARNELAWLTLATLAVQTVPVAPPRLLPATGVVDAGRVLGYAIYAPNGLHDPSQLIAMPSVHMAWALWVAVVVLRSSRSRWRGLVLLHPLLTGTAVVATGYHFWLDAVVAALLLAAVVAADWFDRLAASAALRTRRARRPRPVRPA